MLVSIKKGAELLGVSEQHARTMIKLGRWPFYTLGPRATRIDVDEIKGLGRLIAEGRPSIDEDVEK